MSTSIISGKIDRISHAGNAMIQSSSGSYNMGPHPKDSVGNPVIAVPLDNTWAFCLTPHIEPNEYFSSFCTTGVRSEKNVIRSISEAAPIQMDSSEVDSPFGSSFDGFPDPPDGGIKIGDVIDAQIYIGGIGTCISLFSDGTAIAVEDTFLPSKTETALKIIGKSDPFLKATLDESILEKAPDVGEEVTVKIEATYGSDAYSIIDGVPFILPNCPVGRGDVVRVGVESFKNNKLVATITSLPTGSAPQVGDVLSIYLDNSDSKLVTTTLHEGMPIETSSPLLPVTGNVPIVVTEVRKNSVQACIDFLSIADLRMGDEINLEGLESVDDYWVGRYQDVPVIVPSDDEISVVPDRLPVKLIDITASGIVASVKNRPEIEALETGNHLTVQIKDQIDGYLLGDIEGIPVWISFNSKISPRAPRLSVEIEHISDCGIHAVIPAFRGSGILGEGEIVPAHVQDVGSRHITAIVEASIAGDQYEIPVFIPIALDLSGKIGVEIIDQDYPYLVAGVRTPKVGADVETVSKYVEEGQRGLFTLRDEKFNEATKAWEQAARVTHTDVRRVEALRWRAFTAQEAIISEEGIGEYDLEFIDDLESELDALSIPDEYYTIVSKELHIYKQLLTIKQMPSQITGLQQIAYSVDGKGRLQAISNQIQRDLVDEVSRVEDLGWALQMPHPLLIRRFKRVCDNRNQEFVVSWIADSSPIKKTCWAVPPGSAQEANSNEITTTISIPETLTLVEPGDADGPESSPDKRLDQGVQPLEKDSDEGTSKLPSPPSPVSTESEDPTDESDLSSSESGPIQDQSIREQITDRQIPQSTKTLESLRRDAEASASNNPIRDTSSPIGGSRYQRAPAIKRYAKTRADGICEACGEAAPFVTPDGEPYLEVHHVDELGKGGIDHPSKVVAVCPTCHKRIHHGADGDELNQALRERLEDGLADVGTHD